MQPDSKADSRAGFLKQLLLAAVPTLPGCIAPKLSNFLPEQKLAAESNLVMPKPDNIRPILNYREMAEALLQFTAPSIDRVKSINISQGSFKLVATLDRSADAKEGNCRLIVSGFNGSRADIYQAKFRIVSQELPDGSTQVFLRIAEPDTSLASLQLVFRETRNVNSTANKLAVIAEFLPSPLARIAGASEVIIPQYLDLPKNYNFPLAVEQYLPHEYVSKDGQLVGKLKNSVKDQKELSITFEVLSAVTQPISTDLPEPEIIQAMIRPSGPFEIVNLTLGIDEQLSINSHTISCVGMHGGYLYFKTTHPLSPEYRQKYQIEHIEPNYALWRMPLSELQNICSGYRPFCTQIDKYPMFRLHGSRTVVNGIYMSAKASIVKNVVQGVQQVESLLGYDQGSFVLLPSHLPRASFGIDLVANNILYLPISVFDAQNSVDPVMLGRLHMAACIDRLLFGPLGGTEPLVDDKDRSDFDKLKQKIFAISADINSPNFILNSQVSIEVMLLAAVGYDKFQSELAKCSDSLQAAFYYRTGVLHKRLTTVSSEVQPSAELVKFLENLQSVIKQRIATRVDMNLYDRGIYNKEVALQKNKPIDDEVLKEEQPVYTKKDFQLRKLTETEVALMKPVFADGIDYQKVRLAIGRGRILEFADGMSLSIDQVYRLNGGRAFAFGNTIFAPSAAVLRNPGLLSHELCHVWQFQRTGMRYAVDALRAQGLARRDNAGDDSAAYNYQAGLINNQSFINLNPEQQAEVARCAFTLASTRAGDLRLLVNAARAEIFIDKNENPEGYAQLLVEGHTDVTAAIKDALRIFQGSRD